MAQTAQVMKGSPDLVVSQLNTLAATEEILVVCKTFSAGSYLVVSDDAAPASQTAQVITGDPEAVVDDINALGADVDVVELTFSSGSYIVVTR